MWDSSLNEVVGVEDLRLGLRAAYFLGTSEGVTECSQSFFWGSWEGGILRSLAMGFLPGGVRGDIQESCIPRVEWCCGRRGVEKWGA